LFLVYSWCGGLYSTIIENIYISEIKNKGLDKKKQGIRLQVFPFYKNFRTQLVLTHENEQLLRLKVFSAC